MITAHHESWPLAEPFTISRGTKSTAEVVSVTVEAEGFSGRGECVPYHRYGETVHSVLAQIESVKDRLNASLDRGYLSGLLPAGAARNALDAALWDWEAKRSGLRAWDLAGIQLPDDLVCAYTLSLADPLSMRTAACRHAEKPLLKMKVGANDALQCINAVREGAPDSALIVDANEAWSTDLLKKLMPELAAAGVGLLEQPLPAGQDAGLEELEHLIPVAADESCHTSADVDELKQRYDVVNIKLDKSGGLTEALVLKTRALECGMDIMIGCMVGTSLAMAPAMLVGPGVSFVDLDGPLLLAEDRPAGLRYSGGKVFMPERNLWG